MNRSVSLRLRIALWYGGLTGLVIVLVCLLAYAIHSRAHYDDLDGTLASAAEHIADEYLLAATPAERAARMAASISVGLLTQVYGPGGEVVAEGRWISGRRRVLVAEARLVDAAGDEIGRGTGTFMRSHIALSGLEGYATALRPLA